jgi:hypothetical protein
VSVGAEGGTGRIGQRRHHPDAGAGDLLGKNYLGGAAQQALGNAMIGYWASFARTEVPSAAGAPAWPKLWKTVPAPAT